MKTNKIAVIGGSGKSGKYVVKSLLEKGYQLKLLLRHPQDNGSGHPLIEIIKGDVRDQKAVNLLLKDCGFVISTLGQPKGERSIFSEATENIIRAMEHEGIRRYIVTTGLSVNTAADHKNERVTVATDWMYQNYPETTQDKQKEYELLLESTIDWTLIRLPLIHLTDEHFATETDLTDCKGESISAADLAVFLVSQIENEAYVRKSPFLYTV